MCSLAMGDTHFFTLGIHAVESHYFFQLMQCSSWKKSCFSLTDLGMNPHLHNMYTHKYHPWLYSLWSMGSSSKTIQHVTWLDFGVLLCLHNSLILPCLLYGFSSMHCNPHGSRYLGQTTDDLIESLAAYLCAVFDADTGTKWNLGTDGLMLSYL